MRQTKLKLKLKLLLPDVVICKTGCSPTRIGSRTASPSDTERAGLRVWVLCHSLIVWGLIYDLTNCVFLHKLT